MALDNYMVEPADEQQRRRQILAKNANKPRTDSFELLGRAYGASGAGNLPNSAMPTMDLSGGAPSRAATIGRSQPAGAFDPPSTPASPAPVSAARPNQTNPSAPTGDGLTPAQRAQAFRVNAYNGRMQYRNAMRAGASPEQLAEIKRRFMQNDVAAWGETAQPNLQGPPSEEQVLRSRASLNAQAQRIAEMRAREAAAGISNDPVYDAGQGVLPENLREKNQQFTSPSDQVRYRDFARFAAGAPEIDFGAGEVSSAAQRAVMRQKMQQDRIRAESDGGFIPFAPYDRAEAGQRMESSQRLFADNKSAADEARKQILARQEKDRALAALGTDLTLAEGGARLSEAKSRETMANALDPELARSAIRAQQEAQVAQARAQAAVAEGQGADSVRTSAFQRSGVDEKRILQDSLRFAERMRNRVAGGYARTQFTGDIAKDTSELMAFNNNVTIPIQKLSRYSPQEASRIAADVLAGLPETRPGGQYDIDWMTWATEPSVREYANKLNAIRSSLQAIASGGASEQSQAQ